MKCKPCGQAIKGEVFYEDMFEGFFGKHTKPKGKRNKNRKRKGQRAFHFSFRTDRSKRRSEFLIPFLQYKQNIWGVFTYSILASIVTILVSIKPILEKCGHLQGQYSRILSQNL